jgi:precorrin-2 dehydrogenase/sirohydrochlorin ferrochelatase
MIVDLNIHDKIVVVIGGGNEAQKRINSILNQECKIIVISDSVNSQINKLEKAKKIILKKQKIQDTKVIFNFKPDIIITTTNDKKLNQKILSGAKKNKIIAYSSDNPEESDFSNPAIFDIENMIRIAIFTNGRSPSMSKKIRIQAEKIFKDIITKEDIDQIKIQQIARTLAKSKIDTQVRRKSFLKNIMSDSEIKQLIKDGKPKKAENRIIAILRDWK